MSLIISGLRVDDSNELPASMENWLNAGADWTEHHGIDLTPTALVSDLLYEPVIPPVARPFLKLDALELCKETTGGSSMVGSDSSSSIESSARDSSSPAARGDSSSLSPAGARKRSFDDLQTYGVPAAAVSGGGVPAVAAAAAMAMVAPGAGAGILFPGGAGAPTTLTLPSVPSMEEIAQSRPKRRNVKISTDPQSVAARHRRERISDRVRVLQHFVPGGTKMDTASMLDEAIHYVKFLQEQLQKLERLGNSYDARFMNGGIAGAGTMMIPQSNNVHPFDLNYCTYPTTTTSMMLQQSHQQHQQQASQNININSNNNNTTSSWSPRLQCIQDHEQFCH